MRSASFAVITFGLCLAAQPSADVRAQNGSTAPVVWPLDRAGELVESVATLERRAFETPDDPDGPEFLWRRAHALAAVDRFEEAIAICGVVVQAYPDSELLAEVLTAQAAWHRQLNQAVECEAVCRRVMEHAPDSPHRDAAAYLLGWALGETGREAEAAEVYAQLAKDSPASRHAVDAACRAAETARKQGRLDEARRLLETAIDRRDPEYDPVARLALATVASQQNDWATVLDVVEPLATASTAREHRLAALFWKAESAFRLGDWPGARRRFDELEDACGRASRESKPKDATTDAAVSTWLPAAFVRRGQIAAHESEWALAREWAARGLTEFPGFARSYEFDYLLARALVADGRLDDAHDRFASVAKAAGETETAWAARWMQGETRLMQQRPEDALTAYARLHDDVAAPPGWRAAAWLQAGKCCETLARWEAAKERYALAQAIDAGQFGGEASTRLAEVDRRRKANVPQQVGRTSR